MADELLRRAEVDAALGGLHEGWSGTTERLVRSVEFADFPTAVELSLIHI